MNNRNRRIICKNVDGNSITFSYESSFFLEECEGIRKMSATIATIKSAFSIGTNYVGTSLPERNIVITGFLDGNIFDQIQLMYKVFPLNSEGTFIHHEYDRVRSIKYRVEDLEIADKGFPRSFSISLICPNPYFTDDKETLVSLSNWLPSFEFPLEFNDDGIEFGYKNMSQLVEIENDTSIDIGIRIVLTATGTVVNPKVLNATTNEELKLNFTMQNGDEIIITTYMNNKKIILNRNRDETNITNSFVYGSKFLQVHSRSTNLFKIDCDSGLDELTATIYYLNMYEAV